MDMSNVNAKRRSYENEEVKTLYRDFLGNPGSERSQNLLHTNFAERHSPREYLAKFLDAVDARDGGIAASLFERDGVWDTSSQFGCFKGPEKIKEFITSGHLPEGKHVLVSPTHGMLVRGPNGKLSAFQVEINHETHSIRRLTRTDASNNPDIV